MKKKKQPKTLETSARTARKKWRKVAASSSKSDEVWDRLIKIGEELGKGWQNEKSAVEILSEIRR